MIHLHSTNPAQAGFSCREGDFRGRVTASRFVSSFFVPLCLCVSKIFSHEDTKTRRKEDSGSRRGAEARRHMVAAGAAGLLA